MVDIDLNFFQRLLYNRGRNTVRILLDLDGTIVPEGRMDEDDYQVFRSNGFEHWRIRNEVVDFLRDYGDDSRVELIWATTWEEYANTIFDELGLEDREFLRFDSTYNAPQQWFKEDRIVEFLEEVGDPVVIVDDELSDRILAIDNPRLLAIRTDSLFGLTEDNIAQIESFLESYRTRSDRALL